MKISDSKFQIIYADPPWTYQGKMMNSSVTDHYSVMGIRGICDLPVRDIADKDCVLLMWVTYPKLNEFMKVVEAWGFEYKSVAFTWVKKNKKADSFFFGLGRWTRANPEICVIATKGNPKRISASVANLIIAPIGRHSEKPSIVRDKIVQLLGDLPRIELFAREKADGWDSWGNEVNK